jgi:RNA polymerase sigma-70 factor (ECF subfamily)
LTARESAFSAFFETHERRLRAFALRRTHDPVAADDLVAATMEIAWAKFEQVQPSSAFGWLCGTAIRVQANDTRTKRRRQANVERLVAEAETRPMTAYLESQALLPEQREAIVAAFQRLSEDDRELLRLAVWDGLDDNDLAAAFDLNPAAARKRLSRARQRFRECYAEVTTEPAAGAGGA